MQETNVTAADTSPAADPRRHPVRALAAAASLAAAGAVACSPIFAGLSLNHNETLVRSGRRRS